MTPDEVAQQRQLLEERALSYIRERLYGPMHRAPSFSEVAMIVGGRVLRGLEETKRLTIADGQCLALPIGGGRRGQQKRAIPPRAVAALMLKAGATFDQAQLATNIRREIIVLDYQAEESRRPLAA